MAMTPESMIGWVVIAAVVYILWSNTMILTRFRGVLSGGSATVRSRMSRKRAFDIGGFSLGLFFGPVALEWVLALLGGFLGGFALNGAGISDPSIVIAGALSVAVFMILVMRGD